MSQPLFTPEELTTLEAKYATIRAKENRADHKSWSRSWEEQQAVGKAHEVERCKRARARADEFLDGLLVTVGSRGSKYLEFDSAFANSDDIELRKEIAELNTPEARRSLFTILKALTEVPKSWATSAFLRFLRGTGKQKDAKYHGAGTFGLLYGWKEDEVKNICEVITGRGDYCKVLMSYADMYSEISDAQNKDEDDPDYVEIDYSARFTAVNVSRDKEFLEKLCQMLEAQGLGPVPTPAEAKPKKERKVKVFHSGDIITKSNMRDLPLPAHVRIPIEREDPATRQWVDSTIEYVVTALGNSGYFSYAIVPPGNTKMAFPRGSWSQESKGYLEGATFLGEWTGEIAKKKTMDLKFYFRQKQKQKKAK